MTLIEVLISLLLLSLMLLGFIAADVSVTQEERIDYIFSAAENQVINMIERLIALRNNAGLSTEIAIWNQENHLSLPMGVGSVKGKFPKYTVIVAWGGAEKNCVKTKTGEKGCITEKIQLE